MAERIPLDFPLAAPFQLQQPLGALVGNDEENSAASLLGLLGALTSGNNQAAPAAPQVVAPRPSLGNLISTTTTGPAQTQGSVGEQVSPTGSGNPGPGVFGGGEMGEFGNVGTIGNDPTGNPISGLMSIAALAANPAILGITALTNPALGRPPGLVPGLKGAASALGIGQTSLGPAGLAASAEAQQDGIAPDVADAIGAAVDAAISAGDSFSGGSESSGDANGDVGEGGP